MARDAAVKGREIVIYHNPACGTSRKVLALIRSRGFEPRIIRYLETPPTREEITGLLRRLELSAFDLLRRKEVRAAGLDIDDPALTEEALLAAMAAHPALIERPIVLTPWGARLCRPPERVLDILPPGG